MPDDSTTIIATRRRGLWQGTTAAAFEARRAAAEAFVRAQGIDGSAVIAVDSLCGGRALPLLAAADAAGATLLPPGDPRAAAATIAIVADQRRARTLGETCPSALILVAEPTTDAGDRVRPLVDAVGSVDASVPARADFRRDRSLFAADDAPSEALASLAARRLEDGPLFVSRAATALERELRELQPTALVVSSRSLESLYAAIAGRASGLRGLPLPIGLLYFVISLVVVVLLRLAPLPGPVLAVAPVIAMAAVAMLTRTTATLNPRIRRRPVRAATPIVRSVVIVLLVIHALALVLGQALPTPSLVIVVGGLVSLALGIVVRAQVRAPSVGGFAVRRVFRVPRRGDRLSGARAADRRARVILPVALAVLLLINLVGTSIVTPARIAIIVAIVVVAFLVLLVDGGLARRSIRRQYGLLHLRDITVVGGTISAEATEFFSSLGIGGLTPPTAAPSRDLRTEAVGSIR